MNAKEKLLAKFRKTSPLTKAALPTGKEAQAALKELTAENAVLKIGTRFFLESTAPTLEREKSRIDAKLRTVVKLFKENGLLFRRRMKLPTTRAALDDLVDSRIILRLEIEGDRKAGPLYLHSVHAGAAVPAVSSVSKMEDPPAPASEPSPSPAGSTPRIRQAYAALVERNGSDSVFISALAVEAGMAVGDLQRWIQENIINKDQGALNEGDWSYASEEQRAAAMMFRDRRRLYVRFHS